MLSTVRNIVVGRVKMSERSAPIATCVLRISELRPTQMSVGLIEVMSKRKRIAEIRRDSVKMAEFRDANAIPGVYGPGRLFYIIDHHHMARALLDEAVEETTCHVLRDLSSAETMSDFWAQMTALHWVYPYDHTGAGPQPFASIPTRVCDLSDDVYRSLAGAVEKAGGFSKTGAPFEEFAWADYLRGIIPAATVDRDFDKALQCALHLIHAKPLAPS